MAEIADYMYNFALLSSLILAILPLLLSGFGYTPENVQLNTIESFVVETVNFVINAIFNVVFVGVVGFKYLILSFLYMADGITPGFGAIIDEAIEIISTSIDETRFSFDNSLAIVTGWVEDTAKMYAQLPNALLAILIIPNIIIVLIFLSGLVRGN